MEYFAGRILRLFLPRHLVKRQVWADVLQDVVKVHLGKGLHEIHDLKKYAKQVGDTFL